MTIKAAMHPGRNDFESSMEKMLDRAQSVPAGMARIYKMYQNLQTKRFMTEGDSEGMGWAPVKDPTTKAKRFASYPGGGRKTLIATSTLAGAVIGPGSPFVSEGINQHRFITTSTGMSVSVEEGGENAAGRPFNYPKHVAEERPFMKFSDESLRAMKEELKQFILGK